ncbi:MAG: CDP-alcohol phosphatidyltransferase family protein [Candidatus Zixiibacteriota bacterium]
MVIKKGDFLLVPNLLAIFRILLLPFIFYFLAQNSTASYYIAILLILIAITSDVLDGYFARRLNQITDLGKILDPLADKLGLGIFVIFIVFHREFPIWAAGLLFFKDLLTLIGAIALVKRKDIFPTSNNWGKLNSWVWAFTVILYIVRFDFLKEIFLFIATATVLICTIQYLKMFFDLYRAGIADK